MSQNIKNNYVRYIDSKLYNKHYYDYMLFRGETVGDCGADIDSKMIADFSTLDIVSGSLYSTRTWSGATTDDIVLKDIGLTGVDNGFIYYDKDRISNIEFLKIYLESEYELKSGDTRFFMTPVTGNTKLYQYPMYLVDSDEGRYIACKGGFYQGFFKLEGFDYEVLPTTMTEDIVLHFEIRPRSDYEILSGTVNTIHPENNGTFFFIGTRAENKFWPYYKTGEEMERRPNEQIPYDADDLCLVNNHEWLVKDGCGYLAGKEIVGKTKNKHTVITDVNTSKNVYENYLKTYDFAPYSYCGCSEGGDSGDDTGYTGNCDSYIADDYFETCEPSKCPDDNGKAVTDEYVEDSIDLKNVTLEDSAGNEIGNMAITR